MGNEKRACTGVAECCLEVLLLSSPSEIFAGLSHPCARVPHCQVDDTPAMAAERDVKMKDVQVEIERTKVGLRRIVSVQV